jgi:hypothetical protein
MGRNKDARKTNLCMLILIADRSGVGFQFTMIKWVRDKQVPKCLCTPYILDYYSKQYLSLEFSYNYNFKIDIDEFNPDFENPVLDPSTPTIGLRQQ